MSRPLRVAVLGLGEAGGALALDLVRAGCRVRGWDPGRVAPAEVPQAADDHAAVAGADLVLSVASAAVARKVAESVRSSLAPRQLYADLNTSSPALKAQLEQIVRLSGAASPSSGQFLATASGRLRSPRDRAPSVSPSSSAPSECPWTSSGSSLAPPPRASCSGASS